MPTFGQAGAVSRNHSAAPFLCPDSRATCHIFGDFFLASRLSLARAMVPRWQPVVSVGFRAFSRLRLVCGLIPLPPARSEARPLNRSFYSNHCRAWSAGAAWPGLPPVPAKVFLHRVSPSSSALGTAQRSIRRAAFPPARLPYATQRRLTSARSDRTHYRFISGIGSGPGTMRVPWWSTGRKSEPNTWPPA